MLTVWLFLACALAQQQVLEYEDDFAQSKWAADRHAGQPTRVIYPPAHLSETFNPTRVFSTPTQYLGPVKRKCFQSSCITNAGLVLNLLSSG